MRVVYKAPGRKAEVMEIRKKSQAVRDLLGGDVSTKPISEDACVVFLKEGCHEKLPYNCDILRMPFYGPIALIGIKDGLFADYPLLRSGAK